jgi:hypothetical protein
MLHMLHKSLSFYPSLLYTEAKISSGIRRRQNLKKTLELRKKILYADACNTHPTQQVQILKKSTPNGHYNLRRAVVAHQMVTITL